SKAKRARQNQQPQKYCQGHQSMTSAKKIQSDQKTWPLAWPINDLWLLSGILRWGPAPAVSQTRISKSPTFDPRENQALCSPRSNCRARHSKTQSPATRKKVPSRRLFLLIELVTQP